jgi:hypothetical protein
MSPRYAIRWWKEHSLEPPDIDPVMFMKTRLPWRYAKGVPEASGGRMHLGNSIEIIEKLAKLAAHGQVAKANLLFTSPPYHAITNYHYDQWLRLWLLGGPPNALRNGNGRKGKFEARESYRRLLEQVFTRAAQMLEVLLSTSAPTVASLRTAPHWRYWVAYLSTSTYVRFVARCWE